MPALRPSMLFLAGLLSLAGVAACGVPPVALSQAADDARAGELALAWRRVQAELADQACTASAQCHTLALGEKACGGPERFIAWSSARSDGQRLAGLAAGYAAASRRQDARENLMSTCSVVRDPGAVCRDGRCVLRPPGPALPLEK